MQVAQRLGVDYPAIFNGKVKRAVWVEGLDELASHVGDDNAPVGPDIDIAQPTVISAVAIRSEREVKRAVWVEGLNGSVGWIGMDRNGYNAPVGPDGDASGVGKPRAARAINHLEVKVERAVSLINPDARACRIAHDDLPVGPGGDGCQPRPSVGIVRGPDRKIKRAVGVEDMDALVGSSADYHDSTVGPGGNI